MAKIFIGNYFPSLIHGYEKVTSVKDAVAFTLEETGYMHIQSTKPDTIGFAVTDSPVGLAAYILEKFTTWVDLKNVMKPDGGLQSKLTLDELLTNVMLYWVTNSATSAFRLYKESIPCAFSSDLRPFMRMKIPAAVPVGLSIGSDEFIIGRCSESLARHGIENLIHHRFVDGVGHFTTFENPVKMDKEIREFVSKLNIMI